MTVEQELKKQLAKRFNIRVGQVEEIVASQGSFVVEVMSRKSDRATYKFPSVRVPGLGLFYCPDHVIKNFKKMDQEKNKI
jgi:seryl-tRNA(Sec) selenium transferase